MAEKEYISKEDAIDLLYDNSNLPIDSGTARAYWTRVVQIKDALIYHIKSIPAADVVEVVRCEKCVWWERCNSTGLRGSCQNPKNGISLEYTDNTDFCSYGERKEATP